MKQLKVVTFNGQLVTESREVAKMIDRPHNELMKSIRTYIEYLAEGNFPHSDFFIESTYQDKNNQTRPCFLLTKKGCEMVANKITGERGVLFTAAYVTKFNEMEKQSNKQSVVPLSKDKALVTVLRTTADLVEDTQIIKEEQYEIRRLITDVDKKVDEQITLSYGEQRRLQKAIARRVYELYENPEERPKAFSGIHREIKDRFAVASYKDVRRKDLQAAINYVKNWIPRQIAI